MKSPGLVALLCLAAAAIVSSKPNSPTDSLNDGSTYVINNIDTGLVLAATEGSYELVQVGQPVEGTGKFARLSQWSLLKRGEKDTLPGEWQIVNAFTKSLLNAQRYLLSNGISLNVDTVHGDLTKYGNSSWNINLISEKGSKLPVFIIQDPKSKKTLEVQDGRVGLGGSNRTWTFSLIPA